MADDQWYYTQSDQRLGPVGFVALRGLAAAGSLGAEEYVWQAGMPDWVQASTIPGLFPVHQPAPGGPYGYADTRQQHPHGYAPQPGYAQPAPTNYFGGVPTTPFAGFWLRFVASMIDGIIVSMAGFILLLVVIALLLGAHWSEDRAGNAAVGMVYFLILLLGWLYSALMESSGRGATLGKMMLGLRVTNLQGDRVTFGQASGRYFGKILSAMIFMVGYIMAAFTDRKQALHDIMSGCLVVQKPVDSGLADRSLRRAWEIKPTHDELNIT